MGAEFSLAQVPLGAQARVLRLEFDGAQRRRMLDIGLTPGSEIGVLRPSPMGDPRAYQIHGAVICLRQEEASKVIVQPITE